MAFHVKINVREPVSINHHLICGLQLRGRFARRRQSRARRAAEGDAAGQPDAGTSSGGNFSVLGGFSGGVIPSTPTPTPVPTPTITPTPTPEPSDDSGTVVEELILGCDLCCSLGQCFP